MLQKNENKIMENWSLADEPTVSILCPTYNHEDYIAEALDSFLMQETNFPFEIIVQDDVSTDSTAKIIQTYAEKYPHIIKPIFHTENQFSKGPVHIMMPLFKNAKGKYHATCEGDDYWIDKNKLQIQIDLMEQKPECHVSFHSAEIRLDKDTHGELYAKQADENKIFSTSEAILGGGGFCPSSSFVFRKEVAASLPHFFYDMPVGDYFLQIFGSLNGGLLYIDKVMSVYRQGVAESWSSSMTDIDKRVEFYHKYIKSLDKLDVYLGHKYQNEIRHEKSKQHYAMAVFYLYYNDMFKEFKEYIELSHKTYSLKSLYYFIDYHLRYFPRLIKKLKKLKYKLKV